MCMHYVAKLQTKQGFQTNFVVLYFATEDIQIAKYL